MTSAVKFFGSRTMFLLMAAWLSFYGAIQIWPASWWLVVKSVSVGPAQANQQVPMLVERTVRRNFTASWYVTVRKWTDLGWYTYCGASGQSSYYPDNALPNDLTLDWWTNGQCSTLPAGRFSVDTVWVIHGYGPLPQRRTDAVSNIFEVTP